MIHTADLNKYNTLLAALHDCKNSLHLLEKDFDSLEAIWIPSPIHYTICATALRPWSESKYVQITKEEVDVVRKHRRIKLNIQMNNIQKDLDELKKELGIVD
jgi:hypothetical protein